MPALVRLALPLLAAASTAYAGCSVSATTTIQNGGDASALATCSTFSGSIAVATGTTDDIAIDGIQAITNDFVVSQNSQIKRIAGDTLGSIGGSMTLDNVQVLSTVNFPKLKTVNNIKFNALPNLETLGFDSQVTKASGVDIQNTQLQTLQGLNIATVDTVFIANNIYINNISMQLGNISQALTIADNNPKVAVSFPNLQWAYNLTFRSVSAVDLPSLSSLNGSLGLYTSMVQSFSAPNLTKIGGALAFVSNDQITNVSFPQLTEVDQNLQIANNSKLAEVDQFPKLKTIGGAFDMYGNMTNVSTPALSDVKGAFNLQSSEDVSTACSFYKNLQSNKQIKGSYYCDGKLVDPGNQGSHDTSKKGGSKGAASSVQVQTSALVVAGLAAVFFL